MVVTTESMSGPKFEQGQTVRVSDAAVASGRSFDFGTVHTVNEDGTYGIAWGKAGCLCQGVPNEATDQLTIATDAEWDAYYAGKFPIPNGPDGKPAEEPRVATSFDSDPFEDDDDEEDYDEYEDEEDEEEYDAVYVTASAV